MKTFKQFQEAAFAVPLAGGISKIPSTVGAFTTLFNMVRKKGKRKIGPMEKRLMDRENNVRDNDMIIAKPGEVQKQNKLIDKYTKTEEAVAPTNNVGGGQIAGTVEAGDDPPVKKKKKKKGKKKTYAYGGRGSRKMWMA